VASIRCDSSQIHVKDKMKPFSTLTILTALLGRAWSQTIDLRTNAPTTRPWIEFFKTFVNDYNWTTVASIGTEHVNPIVLTSLPDIGGPLYTQGFPTATRVRNIILDSGVVFFEVKVW
jgi:hypothetical protein